MIYANNTGTCRGTISAYKCLHTIFNPHTLPECPKPNTLFSGVVSRCFVFLHSLIFSELSIAHIILLKPGWSLKCAAYTEGRGSLTIQGETTSMLCIQCFSNLTWDVRYWTSTVRCYPRTNNSNIKYYFLSNDLVNTTSLNLSLNSKNMSLNMNLFTWSWREKGFGLRTASVRNRTKDKRNKSHWSNSSHKVSVWAMVLRSHRNWHPAFPGGNVKSIHDSNQTTAWDAKYGDVNYHHRTVRLTVVRRRGRVRNRSTKTTTFILCSLSIIICGRLWSQPCWRILTKCKMARKHNCYNSRME